MRGRTKGKVNIIWMTIILIAIVIVSDVFGYLFLEAIFGMGSEGRISAVASIGEVIAAVVAAIMIIFQLEQDRMIEKQENQIQEGNFIMQYNQMLLENEDMQQVQDSLTAHYMKTKLLTKEQVINNLQKYVNYLVYLEGIAPLILNDVVRLDNVDDLFAYRFFVAVNNPVLQKETLESYGGFYKGCYKVYKKWKNYRISMYCDKEYPEKYTSLIPMADSELDQLKDFNIYADINHKNEKRKYTFEQWNEQTEVKKSDLYKVAKLIYETDPYIYPALFENKTNAIELLPELILSNKDKMFCKSNIFVIKNNGNIAGIILWKKGPLQWSKDIFINKSKELDINVSHFLDKVYNEYFKSYENEQLGGIISLINVCVDKEYRGVGLGKELLKQFVQVHRQEELELCVLKDNDAAVKLYKGCGFKECSKIYNGFSVDDIQEKPKCFKMTRGKNYDELSGKI